MVLASLLVISTVIVEFAYNAHISYEIAATQRDRLKALYLARSALNLVRLELGAEKRLRQQFADVIKQMAGSEFSSGPFCKLFPLSTGLIEGLSSGSLTGPTEEEATVEEEQEKGENPPEEEKKDLLNLGGDFEGSCDSEEGKINLNIFYTLPTPAGEEGAPPPAKALSPAEQKGLLYALLSQKQFDTIFEDRRDDRQKVVNAIIDWVDLDDRMTEASGMGGGYEESEYSGVSYKPKNGKYGTKAELLLIPGLGDDLFKLLEPNVTVYGDNRINFCQASEETVRAFLDQAKGSGSSGGDDSKSLEPFFDSLKEICSDPNVQPTQVANLIGSYTGGNSSDLASKITTTNRFYTIDAVGESGGHKIRIHVVLDTQNQNPNLWKTLYFRVESG